MHVANVTMTHGDEIAKFYGQPFDLIFEAPPFKLED